MQNIWTCQNKIYYYNFDVSLISFTQSSNESTESCSLWKYISLYYESKADDAKYLDISK